jgi:hypothetical protein
MCTSLFLAFALILGGDSTGPQGRGDPLEPLDPVAFSYDHARHLLLRAGFGGSPEEITELHAMGLQAAVDYLVDYRGVPDELPPHGVTPREFPARGSMVGVSQEERRRLNNMRNREDRQKFQRLRAWWMERMLRTSRPLEEKMTLFWHGHFTSGYRDVRNARHMAQQNELLRRNATGNFAAMVGEISRDPAMLEYLDNNRNNRRAPNENFARELMELFTLGAGNYTETDIKEAARAFTGWTFARGTSQFRFASRNHDFGAKEFLGQNGDFDGDDITRIILEQEATPRYVAGKILTYLAVEPTAEELEPYAELFRSVDYAIVPLLRALFSSKWFYSQRVMATQVKSPVMFVVSALKAAGISQFPGAQMVRRCESIGQAIMQPPNVKGWDGGTMWITSSNLIGRYNIARELVAPRPAGGRGRGRRQGRGASGQRPRVMDTMGGDQARDVPNQVAERFSAYQVVQQAGVSSAEEIVALFEKRFLALDLAQDRKQALIDFLSGADGTAPLNLEARRRANTKLGEFLHLLTTAPEFQLG